MGACQGAYAGQQVSISEPQGPSSLQQLASLEFEVLEIWQDDDDVEKTMKDADHREVNTNVTRQAGRVRVEHRLKRLDLRQAFSGVAVHLSLGML